MSSTAWKCTQCGLVNFAYSTNCKRCNADAPAEEAPSYAPVDGPSYAPAPAGIVLPDGYVMPPPPSMGGVWRDNKTLVMTKEAALPDQCVKCNAPANGFKLKRKLSWHHPALYVVILVAWIIYLVLAVALSKRATVFLGLCPEHIKRRRTFIFIGWMMFALGLITPILAFSNDYPGIGLLGLFLFLVSIFWLVFSMRVLTVKKIDDRLVYLNGVDSNYLSQFPAWQGQY
jgi:hypothetical protein